MSSALSITQSVNPPRAVFLDFPLGHTTGKPGDRNLQRSILVDAMRAFEQLTTPGDIRLLPYSWTENDDWKEALSKPGGDDRAERLDQPQYQSEDDHMAFVAAGECTSCLGFEATNPT